MKNKLPAEKQEWPKVINFNTWRVLKSLEGHPRRVAEIARTGISRSTLHHTILPRLREIDAIMEGRAQSTASQRRVYYVVWLTEKGEKLLKELDIILRLVISLESKVD